MLGNIVPNVNAAITSIKLVDWCPKGLEGSTKVQHRRFGSPQVKPDVHQLCLCPLLRERGHRVLQGQDGESLLEAKGDETESGVEEVGAIWGIRGRRAGLFQECHEIKAYDDISVCTKRGSCVVVTQCRSNMQHVHCVVCEREQWTICAMCHMSH